MKRAVRILVPAALIAAAVMYYPPLRVSALALIGRTQGCPVQRAIAARGEQKRQIEIKDQILKASRKLETDAEGFALWETPYGRFWIPKGSDYVLVRGYFQFHPLLDVFGVIRNRLANGNYLYGATVLFKNEPF